MGWLLIAGLSFWVVIGLWILGMCRAGSKEAKTLPAGLPKRELDIVSLSAEKEGGKLHESWDHCGRVAGNTLFFRPK